MWLGEYQSAIIWLCFGPTGPQSAISPQVQIGGRPIASMIAIRTARATKRRMRNGRALRMSG